MDDTNPEQEHVMSVLEPILNEIYSVFPAAMDKYNEIAPHIRADHENRTAANCVRDHAWMGFQAAFEGQKGFHFLDVRGLPLLNIRDELVIRVKKVDANGHHRNYQTAQQKDFDNSIELEGLPTAAMRVVVGYQPDAAFSEVERVTVRRPKGLWVSQILKFEDEASWVDITPVQLPLGNTRRAENR